LSIGIEKAIEVLSMNLSDFSSSAFYENPYPLYRELREAGALVSLLPTLWITGRYPVTQALLRDKHVGRDFVHYLNTRYDEVTAAGPAFKVFTQSVLMMNPPEHTVLRAKMAKAFGSRYTDKFTSLAENTTHGLIDGIYSKGETDLVAQYASQIPVVVICNLLGLDPEETRLFKQELWHLTAAITKTLEIANINYHDLAIANEGALKLHDFFRNKLAQRRKVPGDDLISLFLSLDEALGMSDEEIISNVIFLFAAGHETSGNMIGNAIICLYRHPETLARIRDNPELLSQCVLECLRHENSLQIAAREVLEDFHFEGHYLRRGDTVIVCLGAANRDPVKFENPDDFLIDRPGLDARELTSFGGGQHYCLGARLAFIEIKVALQTLLGRMPDLQITNINELNWHKAHTLRGVQSLHGRWSV
jgi:cytochrome P450